MTRRVRWSLVSLLLLSFLVTVPSAPTQAAASGGLNAAFQRTWNRTDRPVAAGRANRTWMWGPQANTHVIFEPYAEGSIHNQSYNYRLVQYFDKTRMEITDQGADPVNPWYVTNGLLAKELITGKVQVGDNRFLDFSPAQVNVAGDANDPNGPTYATFNRLMGFSPVPTGWVIIQTVDRAGNVGADQALARYNVTAAYYVRETNHTVASVFWDFMNSTGTIYWDGQFQQGPLFSNPFYATGLPLTEAYWTTVLVGGVPKRVLVQVFERRVLTYTPDNPPGWRVEAGNVGQHYYTWRYEQLGLGRYSYGWQDTQGYSGARDSELSYLDAVVPTILQLSTIFDSLQPLLQTPNLGSQHWYDDTTSRLQYIQDIAETFRSITPPPSLGTLHSRLTLLTDHLDNGARALRAFLDTGDPGFLRTAAAEFAAAMQVLQNLSG